MEIANLGTFIAIRGDKFELEILAEEDENGALVNLSEYGTEWASQLRRSSESDAFVAFAVDTSNIDGRSGDPDDPQLILSLTSAQTRELAGFYVFDVEVGPGPTTLYAGTVQMVSDVTRA